MNMKKMMLMLVALFAMTVTMAQNANGRQPRKMDAATVTTMMTQQLGLNDDQQKKVEALNKKYESVLRPGFGGPRPQKEKDSVQDKNAGQRPGPTEEQKAEMKQRFEQRATYEKELKDILSEDQYKTYLQMRPHHGMSHVQQKDGTCCQQAKGNCCQSDSKVTDKTTEKTDK